MILLVLRDGSYVEVPTASDIVHRNRSLECIDAAGQLLASFNAAEVLAYTCSEASARRLTEDEDEVLDFDELSLELK